VFELMRNFKLPGFERIGDVVPHERPDENGALLASRGAGKSVARQKSSGGGLKRKRLPDRKVVKFEFEDAGAESEDKVGEGADRQEVSDDEFGMGGPENRVYWPLGHDDWLRPRERDAKKAKVEEEEEDGF